MPNLKFEQVTTQEQFNRMKEFAASFDHTIDDSTILPLVMVSRGDKMFAYYTLITHPVVVPAFHPEYCSPRDFADGIQAVKNHHFLSSMSPRFPNGTFFTALPIEQEQKVGTEIINKLGIRTLTPRAELWQAIGGQE